jgi:hypothetical protein
LGVQTGFRFGETRHAANPARKLGKISQFSFLTRAEKWLPILLCFCDSNFSTIIVLSRFHLVPQGLV